MTVADVGFFTGVVFFGVDFFVADVGFFTGVVFFGVDFLTVVAGFFTPVVVFVLTVVADFFCVVAVVCDSAARRTVAGLVSGCGLALGLAAGFAAPDFTADDGDEAVRDTETNGDGADGVRDGVIDTITDGITDDVSGTDIDEDGPGNSDDTDGSLDTDETAPLHAARNTTTAAARVDHPTRRGSRNCDGKTDMKNSYKITRYFTWGKMSRLITAGACVLVSDTSRVGEQHRAVHAYGIETTHHVQTISPFIRNPTHHTVNPSHEEEL